MRLAQPRILIPFALSAMIAATFATPQHESFDLGSQRGEIMLLNPVNGHKLDHGGLIINPTPQKLSIERIGDLDVSSGFAVDDRTGRFSEALEALRQDKDGVRLTIDFGEYAKDASKVATDEGAYLLVISPSGVDITGHDELGAYYGIQTLRQILSSEISDGGRRLPLMTVEDYPAMRYRGLVEGFYGTPWSHDVRMSLIEYLGQNKLKDYIYGPKDDPYHSSPGWREPYPEEKASEIKELVEQSRRHRVNFIWAIHPGKDIRWNEEDYANLVRKFEKMYGLGVRSFAIFFDDIDGDGTDPSRQVSLLNRLTEDFVKGKGDVTNLIVCPTDYSQLWAKPGPDGPLAVYGRELNPDVEVFWTGAVVCSDLTPETLEFVNSRILRPAFYWWNYPVTDYCRHILMQGPVYGLDTTLTREQVTGIVSNPMEHGEASKLALYGVADYAWNPSAYNPIDNWERGLRERVPKDPEAYRRFAIHSADTETGYRRDESWETETFPYDDYTPAMFDSLAMEFKRITETEDRLCAAADSALLKEMKPWLTQFTALGERGLRTLALIKTYEVGDKKEFWDAYLANIMTPAEREAFDNHKVGTLKLQTFYEEIMDDLAEDFYTSIAGERPAMTRGIGTFPYLKRREIATMLDRDTTTFFSTAYKQEEGSNVGIDLREARPVTRVRLLQGRNSIDDGDYLDHLIMEASADGEEWTPLSPELSSTYEFEWRSERPVNFRYVRLRRLDSDRESWVAIRELDVDWQNDAYASCLTPEAEGAFDKDPLTYHILDGTVESARIPGTHELTILASETTEPLKTAQYDDEGRLLQESLINDRFAIIPLSTSAARICVSGKGRLHELIQR